MDLKTPGGRLRYLRERAGMTREKLAEELGCSPSKVEKDEMSGRKLSAKVAKSYADCFSVLLGYNVTPEYILGIPRHILPIDFTHYNDLLLLKTITELRGISIVLRGQQIIMMRNNDKDFYFEHGTHRILIEGEDRHCVGDVSIPLKDVIELDLHFSWANIKNADGEIMRVDINEVSINGGTPIPFYYFAASCLRIFRDIEAGLNSIESNYSDFKFIHDANAD